MESWTNWVSIFVQIVTAAVLIWTLRAVKKYTEETQKLRSEAEKQTAIALKQLSNSVIPVLTLSCNGQIVIRNIGNGPALNIVVIKYTKDKPDETYCVYPHVNSIPHDGESGFRTDGFSNSSAVTLKAKELREYFPDFDTNDERFARRGDKIVAHLIVYTDVTGGTYCTRIDQFEEQDFPEVRHFKLEHGIDLGLFSKTGAKT